jgi:hypothetical protein
LQKPPKQTRGFALPAHWASLVQLGWGRVSTAHAPWLQYLPLPHCESAVHWGAHEPATQIEPEGQASPLEQSGPTASGLHTPRSQLNPFPQAFVASHPARHWPSAQTLSPGHSLEKVQVLVLGVHEPATQVSFALHWVAALAVVQGQGPLVPPQALQAPATQVEPEAQSLLSVHSRVFGGVVVAGATQREPLQTSPWGQAASELHFCAHPTSVQTASTPQAAAFLQLGLLGVGTEAQP